MSLMLLRTTPTTPLLAAAIGRPIAQYTPNAVLGNPNNKGDAKVFTATIDWKAYGASANIPVYLSINIASSSPSSALTAIRSVYVDNTFSATPVYIYFPDTEFCVFCPAYSCTMAPVWTNSNSVAYVFANLFNSTEDPVTTVQFSDACHAGYVIAPFSSGGAGSSPVTGLTINRLLLVGGGAGGGGGGNGAGGGGGAGGFSDSSVPFVLAPGAYPVTVGQGGPAGGSGTASSFNSFQALGGGRGAAGISAPAQGGGSGGGGNGDTSGGGDPATAGAAGFSGQGFSGGGGAADAPSSGGGGGGGGCLSAPLTASSPIGTSGGTGQVSNIAGTSRKCSAGGGGGGGFQQGAGGGGRAGGVGGLAGGGQAGGSGGFYQANGQAASDTGCGGGGGGVGAATVGGTGRDGVVVIRYTGAAAATGGTISTVGGDTVHTFTSNGTFTVT